MGIGGISSTLAYAIYIECTEISDNQCDSEDITSISMSKIEFSTTAAITSFDFGGYFVQDNRFYAALFNPFSSANSNRQGYFVGSVENISGRLFSKRTGFIFKVTTLEGTPFSDLCSP